MHNINNYTDKPITEFTEDDTLFLKKNVNGYGYTFLIKFKKFGARNQVTGTILEIQPNNIRSLWIGDVFYQIGGEISGSILKCYTYQPISGCKWFEKINNLFISN